MIDCVFHFENYLAALLFLMIYYSDRNNSLDIWFPMTNFFVNITLMAIRNISFEMR